MALPQQGTETDFIAVININNSVLMALPQQGTETNVIGEVPIYTNATC